MPYTENIANAPNCEPATKQPNMKEIMQDTNKCLRECVLQMMDIRELLCGHAMEPDKEPEAKCLLDEAMCSNGQAHRLLNLIREIGAVMM